MTTNPNTRQTAFEQGGVDSDSVRANGNVAWYADRNGDFYPPEDTPVYVGDVYELVAAILKYAPFRSVSGSPDAECIIEVTHHRAWPGLATLVLAIFEDAHLYDEARRV